MQNPIDRLRQCREELLKLGKTTDHHPLYAPHLELFQSCQTLLGCQVNGVIRGQVTDFWEGWSYLPVQTTVSVVFAAHKKMALNPASPPPEVTAVRE